VYFSYVLFCSFAIISFTSSVSFVFCVSAVLSFFLSLPINNPILCSLPWTPFSFAQGIEKLLITINTANFYLYRVHLRTRAAARFNNYVVIAGPLKHIQTKITKAKLVPGCGAGTLVFMDANAKTEDWDQSLTTHN